VLPTNLASKATLCLLSSKPSANHSDTAPAPSATKKGIQPPPKRRLLWMGASGKGWKAPLHWDFLTVNPDLGWQILHKCPDGHAKTLVGKTRQAAIDEWNFYCELTGKAAAVILTFLITKSAKGASSRAAPFFMAAKGNSTKCVLAVGSIAQRAVSQ
jgi:hypothetical protein